LENQILTVSELTKEIKYSLEENFSRISVIGEISNFKSHISGHWYFNLKDSGAVINCTMWKGFNSQVYFTPADGMKVIVNGNLTVYPPRGNYQLDSRSMKPAGEGELQAAFEKLKQKLKSEGMFDEEIKKAIPAFPQRIGIVTAIGGAALKDMISVAARRFPLVELVISPSSVQGAGAADTIVNSIKQLNKRNDIDVIIVGRGGGSIEDLWPFNEEIVARVIYSSRIPVISAVGHEVDFTISDFVADLRAPTPSAAMELATPDINEVFGFLNEFLYNASTQIESVLETSSEGIKRFLNSYAIRYPLDQVRKNQQKIDHLTGYLVQNIEKKMLLYRSKLSVLNKTISVLDINNTLKRGFVLVKQNSKYITKAKQFIKNEDAELQFSDGEIII